MKWNKGYNDLADMYKAKKAFPFTLANLMFIAIMVGVTRAREKNTSELTQILQTAMKNYDKRILPSKNGEAIKVWVQTYLVDMVPVKKYHMHYTVNMFFRQSWTDFRLKMPLNGSEHISMASEAYNSIWKPDVHFPLAKEGKMHSIPKLNIGIQIHPNGKIYLSRFISFTLFCPMDLHTFPFDQQVCKLTFRLYAYNNDQCRLEWDLTGGGPIYIQQDMPIFEFNLKNYTYDKTVVEYGRTGSYDLLRVNFILKRRISFYIFQYILPCVLIVILSWVGFWIDHRSVPARASLGITTVLTITTLSNSIRVSLPNVAYIKSIDVYLLFCFMFVFATTVEFAVVGITDIKWIKSYRKRQQQRKNKTEVAMQGRENLVCMQELHIDEYEDDNPEPISQMQEVEKTKTANSHPSLAFSLSTEELKASEKSRGNSERVSNAELSSGDETSLNSEFDVSNEELPNTEALEVSKSGASLLSSNNSTSIGRSWTKNGSHDKKFSNEVRKRRENVASIENHKEDMDSYHAKEATGRWRRFVDRLIDRHVVYREQHVIDRCSRRIFPVLFVVFNFIFFIVVYFIPHKIEG